MNTRDDAMTIAVLGLLSLIVLLLCTLCDICSQQRFVVIEHSAEPSVKEDGA